MITLRRRMWGLSLVGIALAGCGPQAKFRSTLSLNIVAVPDAPVDVTTRNGAVVIEAAEGPDVRIVAEVRAISQERADAVQIDAQRSADGTLVVAARWPDDIQHNNEACSFDIRLPGASGARVRTTNGAVRLVGLAGLARVETTNGEVTIRSHAGDVHVDTTNGAITVDDAAGKIELASTNGRVRVLGARGSVDCTTSNGAVHVAMAPDAPGPVNVSSSNAAIELVLGRGFQGTIHGSTSNGRVWLSPRMQNATLSSRGGEASVELTPGGPVSHLRTSNGSVSVTQGE